jgi:ribose transport system substrate-binding protein
MGLLTAACGGHAASATGADDFTQLRPGKPADAAAEAALADLPTSVRDAYAGFWQSTRLGPNPFADWKAPKGQWQLCYSSSYQGNPWRAEGLTVAQKLTQQLADKDLAKPELLTADANNNASVQASQINNMVQRGCDVIFVMQPPAVGLCQAFDNARKAGVLTVAVQTGTECTNVIQSDADGYRAGQLSADWLIKKIGGSGHVVMCNAIPGVLAADSRSSAAREAFKAAGITVDEITGQWTASKAKTEMLSYLSTHQDKVDAVWDAGECPVAVAQAFEQTGRDVPWLTGFDGACPWLAQWKESGRESFGFAQGGGQAVVEAYKVALRMLAGQKPVVNTLVYPLAQIDSTNFDDYYKAGMTVNSTCNAQPQGGESVKDTYYDALFKGGEAPVELSDVLSTLSVS